MIQILRDWASFAAVASCSNVSAGDFIKSSNVLIAPNDRLVITIGSAAGDKIVWTVGVAAGIAVTERKMICDSTEGPGFREMAIETAFNDLLSVLNSGKDDIDLETLLKAASLEWCSWG